MPPLFCNDEQPFNRIIEIVDWLVTELVSLTQPIDPEALPVNVIIWTEFVILRAFTIFLDKQTIALFINFIWNEITKKVVYIP